MKVKNNVGAKNWKIFQVKWKHIQPPPGIKPGPPALDMRAPQSY